MKTPREVWQDKKRAERQELVNLYYIKGLSIPQIARKKHRHPQTIWNRLNRAVQEQNA